jgi:molecular chaperone GrpE
MKIHSKKNKTDMQPATDIPDDAVQDEAPNGDTDDTASCDDGSSETTDAQSMETVPAKTHTDLNEKYLRLMAEFDNFRKRTVREKGEIALDATGGLVRELIPILDNLDRATEHRNDTTTLEEYVKGIALIEDQIRQVLAGAGLEVIEAVGTPFDPEIHEAVMQIESEEHESGTVTSEVEKGYMIRHKIIRHPKVIVAK